MKEKQQQMRKNSDVDPAPKTEQETNKPAEKKKQHPTGKTAPQANMILLRNLKGNKKRTAPPHNIIPYKPIKRAKTKTCTPGETTHKNTTKTDTVKKTKTPLGRAARDMVADS